MSYAGAEKPLHLDLILEDMYDDGKPPIRVRAYGGLAHYILDLEGTDAEERYLTAVWYYDRNLELHRVEWPSRNSCIPAKIIAVTDTNAAEVHVFGPVEHLETNAPEAMDRDTWEAWVGWKHGNQ